MRPRFVICFILAVAGSPPLTRTSRAVTVRSVFRTLPLAALVAVLAHLAAFGTWHAPGGGHSSGLLAALALGLGLPLGAAFLGLERAARSSVATGIRDVSTVLGIGVAAVLMFGSIELAEGRAALPLAALLAVVPLAALAVAGSRLARRLAGRAGLRAQAWARVRVRRAAVLFVRRVRAALRAALRTGRLAGGERAPPVLA